MKKQLTKLQNIARVSKPVTWFLGSEYKTSLDLIEIDITYDCNLKCRNCNRSCSQAPSNSKMTTAQIDKFLRETTERDSRWRRIRILGGEPFLHPEIGEILDTLINFKKEHSPSTILEISTNGFGDIVKEGIQRIPPEVLVNNSYKENTIQKRFEPFNMAPCDLKQFSLCDFTNGCWITSECGMGLNRHGFYHCAVAAGIDRIMGHNVGLKKLPTEGEQMNKQKELLCKYCGHFITRSHSNSKTREIIQGELISESWRRAYKKYFTNNPILSLY